MMQARHCLICSKSFTPDFDAETSLYCSHACAEQAQILQECLQYLLYDTVLSMADFQALLRDYTLREWAREMVWQQGDLEFMVCEDYTFADATYHGVTLLHDVPIQRVKQLTDAWSAVFFDYEVIPNADAHERKWRAVEEFVEQRLANGWLLNALAQSASSRARMSVAKNPHTPPATLYYLVTLDIHNLHCAIAKNSATPADLLLQLAQDAYIEVRVELAENPALPVQVMRALLQDEQPRVRQTLVRHPALPADLFTVLAHDSHEAVRREVAMNVRTSPALLELLAQDVNRAVSNSALRNPLIPLSALEQAAHAADWVTRRTITENAAAPAELLTALSQDASPIVRLGVANHTHTPREVLEKMVKDKMESVRRAAQETLAKVDS